MKKTYDSLMALAMEGRRGFLLLLLVYAVWDFLWVNVAQRGHVE